LGDKSFGGGVSLWIELDPIRFFDDYIMDGLSALANEIYIEIMFEELVRALKPAQTARLLKLRLIKKHNNPCLSIDTEVVSYNQRVALEKEKILLIISLDFIINDRTTIYM
jgi:hypothetical protein